MKRLPRHGTLARYVWHYNVKKDKPCERCRKANRQHMKAWNRANARLRQLFSQEFEALYAQEKANQCA